MGETTPSRSVFSSLFRPAPTWCPDSRDDTRTTTGLGGPPPGGWEGETLCGSSWRDSALLLHKSPHDETALITLPRLPVPCRRTRRAKQRNRKRKVIHGARVNASSIPPHRSSHSHRPSLTQTSYDRVPFSFSPWLFASEARS